MQRSIGVSTRSLSTYSIGLSGREVEVVLDLLILGSLHVRVLSVVVVFFFLSCFEIG